MIELYLEGRKADVSERIDMPLTRTFEELTNPSVVCVEHSKTISLPKTKTNNEIFGSLFNLDREIVSGNTNVGVTYNPSRKMKFQLIDNGELIAEGYAKLPTISNSVDTRTYNVVLYDELGDIFQKMSEIRIPEDTMTFTLDRNMVSRSFSTPQRTSDVNSDNIYDWVGFTPQNRGLYDSFDSTQVEIHGERMDMKSILPFTEEENNTIIGEGVNESVYRELRSYYQKPFVYTNKMIQLLLSEFKRQYPEYNVELDNRFFNNKNPYWQHLVYLCDYVDVKIDRTIGRNAYDDITLTDVDYHTDLGLDMRVLYPSLFRDVQFNRKTESETILNTDNINMTINATTTNYFMSATFPVQLNLFVSDTPISGDIQWGICKTNSIELNIRLKNGTNVLSERKYLLVGNHTQQPHPNYSQYTKDKITTLEFKRPVLVGNNWYVRYDMDFKFSYVLPFGLDVNNLHYEIETKWAKPNEQVATIDDALPRNSANTFIRFQNTSNVEIRIGEHLRSGRQSSVGDLLGKDFSLYEFFMRYCKQFGLLFDYDKTTETLRIVTRDRYFEEYTIEDWTEKIDRNYDMEISPVTFEDRYVRFDYDDVDATYYSEYKDRYGVNYGGLKIDTHYEFNVNEKEIFSEGYVPTIMTQESDWDWDRMMRMNLLKTKRNEVMPTLYKISGNKKEDVSLSGNLAFRNTTNKMFDVNMRKVYVTDDTDAMIQLDSYCWVGNMNGDTMPNAVEVNVYPYVDTTDTTRHYSTLWNIPSEVYSENVDTEVRSVYDVAWRGFIEDRYSDKNKKVVAYFNLTPTEYRLFKFNKLVRINNNLYVVNEITDFDPNNRETTKVELIGIRDLRNYTESQDYTHYELFALPPQITFDDNNEANLLVGGYEDKNRLVVSTPIWQSLTDMGRGGVSFNNSTSYKLHAANYNALNPRTDDVNVSDPNDDIDVTTTQLGNYLNVSPTFVTFENSVNNNRTLTITSARPITISNKPSWIDLTSAGTDVIDGVEVYLYLLSVNSINTLSVSRSASIEITNGVNSFEIPIVQISGNNYKTFDIIIPSGETSGSVEIITNGAILLPNRQNSYTQDGITYNLSTSNRKIILTATRDLSLESGEYDIQLLKSQNINGLRTLNTLTLKERLLSEGIVSVKTTIL